MENTKKRCYFITLRENGMTREWVTTCSVAAMTFTHSFGTIGFGLFSKVIETNDIPNIRQNY